ncbi:MAG: hypothetical protein WCO94_08920 [Verrucomicrobiota bacterium]
MAILAVVVLSLLIAPTAQSELTSAETGVLHLVLRNLSSPQLNPDELRIGDRDRDFLTPLLSGFSLDKQRLAEIVIEDGTQSPRRGLIYDRSNDTVSFVGRDRIKSISSIKLFHTDEGYGLFLIEGCEVLPLEIITKNGLPYTIRLFDLNNLSKKDAARKTKG